MGLPKLQINSMKGLFVISDEDILNTGIKSDKNFADSRSNGVLKNSIPNLSQ